MGKQDFPGAIRAPQFHPVGTHREYLAHGPEAGEERSVTVSVIIPCRNEGSFIVPCLESILWNDYPPDEMEVLVADGGSSDGTRERIAELAQKYGNLRMMENPDQIIPCALNRMLRAARGRYILRFDAHSLMPPGYIRQCVELLERTGAWCAGGVCVTRPRGDSPMAEIGRAHV